MTGKEARACDDLGVEVKKGAIKEAIRVIIQLYQYLWFPVVHWWEPLVVDCHHWSLALVTESQHLSSWNLQSTNQQFLGSVQVLRGGVKKMLLINSLLIWSLWGLLFFVLFLLFPVSLNKENGRVDHSTCLEGLSSSIWGKYFATRLKCRPLQFFSLLIHFCTNDLKVSVWADW